MQIQNQNSKKVIYSLNVFLDLQKLGFNPIATTPNPKNNNLICWIFERTPQLMEALDKIINGAC